MLFELECGSFNYANFLLPLTQIIIFTAYNKFLIINEC